MGERTEGVCQGCVRHVREGGMDVAWMAGLLTARKHMTGEMGPRWRGVVFLMRCSTSGHSWKWEGERGITPGPLVTPRQRAGPTGLARRLLWVPASKVVLGFMAVSMQQRNSNPISS